MLLLLLHDGLLAGLGGDSQALGGLARRHFFCTINKWLSERTSDSSDGRLATGLRSSALHNNGAGVKK